MSPMRMSKIESGLRTVLEFNEAFNRHDVQAMLALLGEDCVIEGSGPAPDGTRLSGKVAAAKFWQDLFRDSPQARLEVEDVFGLGLHCVVRWRLESEDSAGTKCHVRGIDVFQLRDGLISEMLSYVKG
jgi:ketosteroid isomerase-like protein